MIVSALLLAYAYCVFCEHFRLSKLNNLLLQKRSKISCKQYHENVPSVLYIGDNWPLFSYSPIFSQAIFAKILKRQFSFQPCSRYML
jgi:hypothetical protein